VTNWGDWAEKTPLTEVLEPVTPETCVSMRPYVRRLRSGLWEAAPITYRKDTGLDWQTGCRLVAWAQPRDGDARWLAMTYLTTCYLAPAAGLKPVHTNPRWRTAWMVFDPKLIRRVEPPTRYPSDYWRDQLSAELERFAASIGAAG
jgi:hypothetical protein